MRICTFFLMSTLALSVAVNQPVHAQVFTVLHTFSNNNAGTNPDGANPTGSLLLSGNTLFGTASAGGTNGKGTIFAINADGGGFTAIHAFNGLDGAYPKGSLVLSSGVLFGTTSSGGSNQAGTIFAVNCDGSEFTVLHTFAALKTNNFRVFTNSDGGTPYASLLLCDNKFYGTTSAGGINGGGTLFSIKTDGTEFQVLHAFTNADGTSSRSDLILSGSTLYGTAFSGGSNGGGTVFAIDTNGANFRVVHAFNGSDGAGPCAGLILSGDMLYGTTEFGGIYGSDGVLFSGKTNGDGFTALYLFTDMKDGAQPKAGLLLSGNVLYGMSYVGGGGCIFSLNTNGTVFTALHPINSNTEGANPGGALISSGTTLYGTTTYGALSYGTVFSLTIPVPYITNISLTGSNLVMNVINGVIGGTYTVLMSPDMTLPLYEWMPVGSNVLTASKNFAITVTNAVDPTAPQRFYTLERQ